MSAPLIPNVISGKFGGKSWPAWQHMWDALGDGEWHRGMDLANRAASACRTDVQIRSLQTILAKAAVAGVLERDVREAPSRKSQTTMLTRLLRSASDSWYRRPAGVPCP